MSDARAAEPGCDDGRCIDRESLDHYDDARTAGTLATAFLLAGGAVAASGAVLYLTEPSPDAGARGAVRASVGLSGASVHVGGAW
jgi:hypothetical protein